ncbi:hypothetical protein BSLA_02r1492 [Burkholderia stabilis]|nr:hypothetical protein BSLA_02r1492 [Burkholderia stabilis]
MGRVSGEASAALASDGERNAAANHVESITVPGERRESGHRVRGSGISGIQWPELYAAADEFALSPGAHAFIE